MVLVLVLMLLACVAATTDSLKQAGPGVPGFGLLADHLLYSIGIIHRLSNGQLKLRRGTGCQRRHQQDHGNG
jgi:hypothetical protein